MIRCMPVLQVSDVTRSEAFYCGKLGFRSHGAWGSGPDFAIVQWGRVTIALDRTRDDGPVPGNQYWAAPVYVEYVYVEYVYVEDADALCAQFRDRGIEILREPEDMPYGLRDFDVRDPDGHVLAFGHDLTPGEVEPGLMPWHGTTG